MFVTMYKLYQNFRSSTVYSSGKIKEMIILYFEQIFFNFVILK